MDIMRMVEAIQGLPCGQGMTLGEAIRMLEAADPEHVAPVGLGKPTSWRGSYNELAFVPQENVTVAQMLAHAHSAVGATFTGYKGGDYTMNDDTPLNLAEWGRTGEPLGPVMLSYMCGQPRTDGS